MTQDTLTPARQAAGAPVFFRITVGLLAMLLVGGAAGAVLLVHEAGSINRQGGWGWLLAVAIYVVATTVVCSVCAVCAAVSLFRRETHRRLSIAILIISCLIVGAFGPNIIRVLNSMRRQHEEAAGRSKGSPRPPAAPGRRSAIPLSADKRSNPRAIQQGENERILELKSKLWEAIRAKNADAFALLFDQNLSPRLAREKK